jgi:hypothetical protein
MVHIQCLKYRINPLVWGNQLPSAFFHFKTSLLATNCQIIQVHPGYRERLGQLFILNKPQTAMQTTSAVSLEIEHDGSFQSARIQLQLPISLQEVLRSAPERRADSGGILLSFVIIIRTDCLLYDSTGNSFFAIKKL